MLVVCGREQWLYHDYKLNLSIIKAVRGVLSHAPPRTLVTPPTISFLQRPGHVLSADSDVVEKNISNSVITAVILVHISFISNI